MRLDQKGNCLFTGRFLAAWGAVLLGMTLTLPAGWSADQPIPRGQEKPPGPATPADEAAKRMTVPKGFSVEVVANEPDIVNPVAMTFDEKGRVWVTESFEYPRRAPGKGRDRVKVLEDADGDGRYEKVTIFAEGLNIPSGIAVGHGGVWVANAPDLLFMQDTDGDGKADKSEVVVTGFGRDDTHELPNSLTWGPDGYLYGINGVFNPSRIEQNGKTFAFTCAIFRINPRTREFDLFCEGTSNPWGIAWDSEGSLFVSACVIDHLWHLTETGYYHRQGGPYPPFTWKIESIVKHKHQKAAYCGIHYYDSDAYPEAYRQKLFMGNIHGNCLNSDEVARAGSTYFGKGLPDFLSANDAWFMPVVQKTGPDGCLYVLDWYDQYHCYQDANRDPMGVDRAKGRLYRIRYQETPRAKPFDLSKESDEQLITRLESGNGLMRDLAQRLLNERNSPETRKKLEAIVLDGGKERRTRLCALWSLVGTGTLSPKFHAELLRVEDATMRAWGVRAAGNMRKVAPEIAARVKELASDKSPDVLVQVAVASKKVEGLDALPLLVQVLQNCGKDELIPHIVWQNLHPLLETQSGEFIRLVKSENGKGESNLSALLPRAIDRILAVKNADAASIAALFTLVAARDGGNDPAAKACLTALATRIQSREISGEQLNHLRDAMGEDVEAVLAKGEKHPLFLDAAILAASWKQAVGVQTARRLLVDAAAKEEVRVAALAALAAGQDAEVLETVKQLLEDRAKNSAAFRGQILSSLGRLEAAEVGAVVVTALEGLEPELKPRAVEVLTQRVPWAKALLAEMLAGRIAKDVLNVNQVRGLLSSGDKDVEAAVTKIWGTIRTDRDPAREKLIGEMRSLVRSKPGDPQKGQVVFNRVCGQCHKIYGQGQDVGPEITLNGRASFEQLLSNVFDPSLVIGQSYQGRTVVTTDGRVLAGLLVEDNDQRVVLKMQGGKLETISRDDVEQISISKLSLMPEGLEKQINSDEMIDLFAFITLDKLPSDPAARPIPGTVVLKPRETSDVKEYAALVGQIAPGFTTEQSGEGGVAIFGEFKGRNNVLRVHPIDMGKACTISRKVDLPAGKQAKLMISTTNHPQGNFQLVVRVNGETLADKLIGADGEKTGWIEMEIDLSKFAGKTANIEVQNKANNWSYEFGYFSRLEIVVP